MSNPAQAKIDAIMDDDTKWSYVLTKVSEGHDLDDPSDVISAEEFERIYALVQQTQNLIDQSARIFDFINLGISQAQISNYDDVCAILEMSHRASQQFSETEMAELMELTMKLERVALEAKHGIFK